MPFDGMLHELAGVAKGQLFLYMRLIGLYRFYAQVQILGDLARTVAFAHETKNLELAIGQIGDR